MTPPKYRPILVPVEQITTKKKINGKEVIKTVGYFPGEMVEGSNIIFKRKPINLFKQVWEEV